MYTLIIIFLLLFIFLVLPPVIVVTNIIRLFIPSDKNTSKKKIRLSWVNDIIGLVFGGFCTWLVGGFGGKSALSYYISHRTIMTGEYAFIFHIVLALFTISIFCLKLRQKYPPEHTAPLYFFVISGIIICIGWTIQLSMNITWDKFWLDPFYDEGKYAVIYSVNCILVGIITLKNRRAYVIKDSDEPQT